MRIFQGMRRPMGGFIMDPDEPNRRQQQERDDRKAEADRLRYIRLAQQTNRRLEMIMVKLDDLLTLVEQQQTKIDSFQVLFSALQGKIKEAMGDTITPSQAMRIDQVFNAASANSAEIDEALKANTDEGEPKPPPAVELPKTKIEVASSANPARPGETVTFSAAVSPVDAGPAGALTGGVTFYADDRPIGEAALDSTGVAAISLPVPDGEHDITATYSGDKNYAASASAEFTQVVKGNPPPTEGTSTGVDTEASGAQG